MYYTHSFVCEQSMELRHEWAVVLFCWHTQKIIQISIRFLFLLRILCGNIDSFSQSMDSVELRASIARISRSNPLLKIQNTNKSCAVDWDCVPCRANCSWKTFTISWNRERKKLFKEFYEKFTSQLRILSQWIANTNIEDINTQAKDIRMIQFLVQCTSDSLHCD